MQSNDIDRNPVAGEPVQGVYVADGFGVRVHVRNKHLVVADGIGSHRREQRFHKATGSLRRLVVLGHTGFVTFEALRWMTDAKVGYLQLDRDGTILATTGTLGVKKAELRRAQALAATNQTGIALTRWILDRKLTGQGDLIERSDSGAAADISDHRDRLDALDALDSLRLAEAHAARTYWRAWADLPVSFVTRHQKRVPDHWKLFGTRGSNFGTGGRLAINPANALLNYLYALLEAETILASQAAGLDPGLGILHLDQRMRASFALDIMETIRPDVDTYLLDLLEGHTFRAGDFNETRSGVTRINPPLTHQLAQTMGAWYDLVAPNIEQAIRILTRGADKDTHLTQNNRRPEPRSPAPPSDVPVRTHCLECGQATTETRKLCDSCRDAKRGVARLSKLSELRNAGVDPAHGGTAASRRGTTNSGHQRAVATWNEENDRPDPKVFTKVILPGLRGVRVADMAEATGLTPGYCSFIRRGIKIPHPRHWPVLADLAVSGLHNQE